MPNWTTLSLTELRAATKVQIIQNVGQWMAANLSKREIIVWLMDADRIPDGAIVTRDEYGRITRLVNVDRDPETGVPLGGCVITWAYFGSGEIQHIVISDRDENNEEIRRRRITHFRDGRQPILEEL